MWANPFNTFNRIKFSIKVCYYTLTDNGGKYILHTDEASLSVLKTLVSLASVKSMNSGFPSVLI